MTSFRPQPGEVGHLTVRATFVPGDGDRVGDAYDIRAHSTRDGGITRINADSPEVVSFERLPLPTNEGAMIIARVPLFRNDGPLLLELTRVETSTLERDTLHWVCVGAGDWVNPNEIRPGWVQINPQTFLPTGGDQ